jgi:hypothetical protein
MTDTTAIASLPPQRRKPPGRKTRPQSGDARYGRSAITNGRSPWGQSTWGRRFRDVFDAIISEVRAANGGAELTVSQQQDCRRATGLIVSCEQQEAIIATGGTVDLKIYGQLGDRLGRKFNRLGIGIEHQLKHERDNAPGPLGRLLIADIERQQREDNERDT